MKKSTLLFILIILTAINGISQVYENDKRCQLEKEDDYSVYNSENTSNLDLIQALEVAGIRINKFRLGKFDKKYNLAITIDEYADFKLLATDTIFAGDNEYTYYKEDNEKYFVDYIDEIKIFTREDDNKFSLNIKTYSVDLKNIQSFKLTNEEQYFNLRNYSKTKWKLDKKIPLLIYASSWERNGFQTFCGAVVLEENEKYTERILSSSPHYFLVSYRITEMNI
ncbi:DUF5041 domain-containing protein [Labilibaculum antarcticum]|uniref:DUF5041 domain-containing protein n=1 Tax=Labilibaculum antarcticum TaxID=1717717 RepID=A0A1Y1CN84_9BACT|nr:DUF5041 domain-containing protein [Labilibaculum antarcticum]BAX81825.1 hypothetical protein ALGA_3527 [Labilibaculum antarcticum]